MENSTIRSRSPPMSSVSGDFSWCFSRRNSFLFHLQCLSRREERNKRNYPVSQEKGATWCVCKDGLGDAVLQKTLDYACGAGADCLSIHQNGGCFLPNTVKAHCSFATNSFFQRKGQALGSCDFSGTAMVTPTDPSISGCAYPSSASPINSGTIPVTGTPTTTNPGTGLTPTTNTPFGSTTPTGVLGGNGNGFGGGSNGLGPSGVGGMNTDYTDGGSRLELTLIANVLAFLLFGQHMV